MEDLYYRKSAQAGRKPRRLFRTLLDRPIVLLLSLGGLVLLLFLLFNDHGIVQRIRLEGQYAELQKTLRDAEAESARLREESRALDDNRRALETVARERYGMHRRGETVYRIRRVD